VYIRARSPLLTEKSAVLLHLEELAEKKKAIRDLETVELYDEAFGEVLPEPQESWDRIIGELRWLCVKTQPKNEDLSLKCFQACLGKGDLEHAKQVSSKFLTFGFKACGFMGFGRLMFLQISNSLEKTFTNSHSYGCWNIASMFFYSVS
jgi:N-terminal acetyltransferase B complex non-catalytic subunit